MVKGDVRRMKELANELSKNQESKVLSFIS